MKNLIKVISKGVCKDKSSLNIRPVLGSVKYKDGIWTGTDLYNTIFYKKDIGSGSFTVDFKNLEKAADILKDFNKFEIIDNNITFKNSKKEITLHLTDLDMFPNIRKNDFEEIETIIDQEILRRSVYIAMDPENRSNTILQCIGVADGYISGSNSFQALHFPDTLNTVKKPIAITREFINMMDPKETGKFYLNNNDEILIEYENYSILSRLCTLSMPNFKAIINNFNYDKEVKFNKEELIEILKDTLKIAAQNPDSINSTIFYLKDRDTTIKASCKNMKIKSKIDCLLSGDPLKIALNIKYILDYLKIDDNKEVTMKLSGKDSTVMINDVFLLIPCSLSNAEMDE